MLTHQSVNHLDVNLNASFKGIAFADGIICFLRDDEPLLIVPETKRIFFRLFLCFVFAILCYCCCLVDEIRRNIKNKKIFSKS